MTAPAGQMTAPVPAVDLPHACEPATLRPVAAPPVGRGRRLIGVDAARGVALLGMMTVHILPPATAKGDMTLPWILASGKAAALFAVLAGVGIAFSAGRERLRGRGHVAAAASLAVRAILIGAVGLLVGPVVFYDDARVILPYYAVLFVLAIPLLRLRAGALAWLAAAAVVVMPLVSHLVRRDLPVPPLANPGLDRVLHDGVGLLTELSLTGVYPALPWLAYLCVGMAVGRSRLTSRGVVIRLTLAGVVVTAAASTASYLALDVLGGRPELESVALTSMTAGEYTDLLVWGGEGTTPTDTLWWLAVLAPHTSTPADLAFTIGTSLVVLGVAILLGRVAATALTPLTRAGSMPLTLYVAHLLMVAAPVTTGSAVGDYAAQVAILVTFALLWRRRFSRGPLEHLVWWATSRTRASVLAAAGPPPGRHVAMRT
ncbi:heparan-alpha-glucosaminide N-acetyltransferase domain-containing protein [Georgenia thermotolerans]|uniref:DUF1624 domain-containing protein n=1 Tax=Georgenia thermotolerans TaxID=527326 RepID=A0A7J5UU53_9MICO|nr:heparan-alpha-glucosaminide N-acetyltransferase domain-containing protein [Georgenia thermotolerans]KAE8765813.1 DUF1624 domain-containing protein [Georgenia thermotolerans]